MNELTHAVVLLLGIETGVTDVSEPRVLQELKALLVTLHERSESAYAYQDTPRGKAALERLTAAAELEAELELTSSNTIPLSPPTPAPDA